MPSSRSRAALHHEDPDDGPTAAEAASQARALRGAAKLATEATTGLTDLVEAMHARIASVPGLPGPADGRTRGITGLVYKTVRGVTRAVGGSVDTLLAVLAPAPRAAARPSEAALPSPEREAVLAALNGVLGDHPREDQQSARDPHGVAQRWSRAAAASRGTGDGAAGCR